MLFRLDDRLGRLRPDAIVVTTIVAAFLAAGLLLGYVIALGEPIPIALTLGAIAGVALLNALPLVIWIVLIGVLLISGPLLMFMPALAKTGWLFSILGFFLTGAAFLYPAVVRQRSERPLPVFVFMAILLFAFGLTSLAYSDGPLTEGIRGGKRYFQFFGILFVLAVVSFPSAVVKRWWIFLIALAIVQLPFAAYQRVALVPAREGMPQVVALDIVVGTMEGSLFGGGSSGVMALLLVFALAFLLASLREGILPKRWFILLALAVLIPLALGEVNLVAVLLPLALVAPYFDLIRRRPSRIVVAAILALPLLVGLAWLYLTTQAAGSGKPLDVKLAEILAYNFGQVGYYGYGLNRTSVYAYWLGQQDIADPVGLLFGHGLGSAFGGLNEPNPGHMDQVHAHMHIGLTGASSVLWDLGVTGLLLFIGMFVSAARYAYRLTLKARPGFDRAFCRALFAMALMVAVMPFYSDAAISAPSLQVLWALNLGLIAWRWRQPDPFDDLPKVPRAP